MIPLCRNCGHPESEHTYEWSDKTDGYTWQSCERTNCRCAEYVGPNWNFDDSADRENVTPLHGKDHPSRGRGLGTTEDLMTRCNFCGHHKLAHLDSERIGGVGECHHASGCQCPAFEIRSGNRPLGTLRYVEDQDEEDQQFASQGIIPQETVDEYLFGKINTDLDEKLELKENTMDTDD